MELTKDEVIAAIKKTIDFSYKPGENYQITAYALMETLKGSTIEDIGKVFRDWEGTKILEGPQGLTYEIPSANFDE